MANGLNIGMSVPGAASLGMSNPADQVANETEEQRKKRLAALQAASRALPGVSSLGLGYGAATGG
jgi:hypothetical protein